MPERTIKELEKAIYDAFYASHPDADARRTVWPEVLEAAKSDNQREALEALLRWYSNFHSA